MLRRASIRFAVSEVVAVRRVADPSIPLVAVVPPSRAQAVHTGENFDWELFGASFAILFARAAKTL